MKPVERYRAELDEIKAPDALKETLRSIPAQIGKPTQADACSMAERTAAPATQLTAEAPQTSTAQGKKGIHFPALPQNWKKHALTAAACFVLGVLTTDALNVQLIPQTNLENAGITSVADEESHLGSAVAPMDEGAYAATPLDEAPTTATPLDESDTLARGAGRATAPAKTTLSSVVFSILLIFSGAILALGSIFVYDKIKQKHLAS